MSTSADQNLLFGMLALQMEFIDRDELIAAMHAWVLEKSRPLSQILLQRGSLSDENQGLLAKLVKSHVQAHGNDAARGLTAVGGAAAVRDELLSLNDSEIEATLAHIPGEASGDEFHAAQTLAIGSIGTNGVRFRILRPHAKGGLGEVWIAEDTELRREVALKEIQKRFATNGDSCLRFLQEAEITGGLEHPGIVPVYSLGQHEDGRPFYAMRLIRGSDMKDAIERFHAADVKGRDPGQRRLEFRNLLDRFLDVCNAVEYAHSRGVLHRDLKPANVMVGRYGETLVVDWGLAKPLGRSEGESDSGEATMQPTSGSGSSATQMGSAVGTPQYMGPEQAAGRLDKLGPTSDVYSLGATLYCLLTGSPPFTEGDVPTILKHVQEGRFKRPRDIKRRVPRPLEAICLKAMALDPGDRYRSVQALSDDLQHYLADEPVQAYVEPLPARLLRWGRRHRVKVALLSGLATAVVAALVATTLVLRARHDADLQVQRRLDDLQQAALDDEQLAVERMQASSFAAAENLLRRSSERLEPYDEFSELRQRLLAMHDRARRLNNFTRLVEQAWSFHYHEYDDESIAACRQALQQLHVLDNQRWWENLPADDLTDAQVEKLQNDAHAVLLLYAGELAKQTLPDGNVFNLALDALEMDKHAPLFRHALEVCAQAQRYRPTHAGSLLTVYCRFWLDDLSLTEALAKMPVNSPAEGCAIDHHFMGIGHFLLYAEQDHPLTVVLRKLNQMGNAGLDENEPRFTSHRLLLEATRLEGNPYWSYIWLGLILMKTGQPQSAELVYNTCITLDRNKPEGYLERARAILEQASDMHAQTTRDHLRRRAIDDLDAALRLAPLLPEVHLMRGQLFARFDDLGRGREAIREYVQWLELTRPKHAHQGRASQRDLVQGCEEIESYCRQWLSDSPGSVDAQELLAMARLAREDYDGALVGAKLVLERDVNRPRTFTVVGEVHLARAVQDGKSVDQSAARIALTNLETAHKLAPDNFAANIGLVRARRMLSQFDRALEQLDAIVNGNVVVTTWQQYDVARQRAIVLKLAGRPDEARAALEAARAINPIAAGDLEIQLFPQE